MNSFQAKPGQVARQWYVIDAADQVVGRLAAQIAPILMGKHRPTYTPHVDTGDYVIVTNVDKVVFTGQKWEQKTYQRYSGYPGGQREEVAWKLRQRRPERILELAVQRMMPKNKLGRHMMSKLKLYVGDAHPHQAQGPIVLEPKSGRPTAAGLIEAPPQVVNPPRGRKTRKKKEETSETAAAAETATTTATAATEGSPESLPAGPQVPESAATPTSAETASAPSAETQADAEGATQS